jgi:signal transduction histidine kinase
MHRRLLSSVAPSVRARLWFLVAIVAVPAALLSSWLIFDSYHNERRAMERHLLEAARAVSLQLDAELRERIATLRGLARSTPLERSDLIAFRARAQRLVPGLDEWVILADMSGRVLVDTRLSAEAKPLPILVTPEMKTALAAGRPFASDLIVSDREPRYFVFVAIPAATGDGRAGFLGVAMQPGALTAALLRNRIPNQEVLALMDRERTVMARSRGGDQFIGRKATTNVQEAVGRMTEGVIDSVTLDGHPSIAAFRVLENGWSVVVGGHKAELFEQAKQRLGVVLVVALLVGAGALGLALWVSRMTERVARHVLLDTQALARGERVDVRHTGIREADIVSRALSQTSRELAARQEALARARDEALAASRAKDEFLAALSHELRTPLNPVLLLASEAARDRSFPPEVRELLATIEKNVLQEARLIDDLLDLTRIGSGKLSLELQAIELEPIVCDAMENLRPLIGEKRLDVRLRLAAERAKVRGDGVRLHQIFNNVLGNAVKFTPEAGIVIVATRLDPAAGTVCVEISDSGIGMTADELARIFRKFAQGDHARNGRHSRFGGLGLGLAITRSLVEMHGGTIEAASAGPGKGSTFIIRLPIERTT